MHRLVSICTNDLLNKHQQVCLDYWNSFILDLFESHHNLENPSVAASMMGLQVYLFNINHWHHGLHSCIYCYFLRHMVIFLFTANSTAYCMFIAFANLYYHIVFGVTCPGNNKCHWLLNQSLVDFCNVPFQYGI